jgi:hypothetical protein
MVNKQDNDIITLFRQAATAMTAGILLILIGTQRLAITGFVFSIYSFILLVAALIQIFPKCHKFPEFMGKFTDELTILFMFISLFSILRNWTGITTAINSGNKTVEQDVSWVQSVSSHVIPYWLILFLAAFMVVALFDILRRAWRNIKILGLRRGFLFTSSILIYALGCWGIARFGTVTLNVAWLIPSLLVTIGSGVSIVCQKAKIKRANIGTRSLISQSEIGDNSIE